MYSNLCSIKTRGSVPSDKGNVMQQMLVVCMYKPSRGSKGSYGQESVLCLSEQSLAEARLGLLDYVQQYA